MVVVLTEFPPLKVEHWEDTQVEFGAFASSGSAEEAPARATPDPEHARRSLYENQRHAAYDPYENQRHTRYPRGSAAHVTSRVVAHAASAMEQIEWLQTTTVVLYDELLSIQRRAAEAHNLAIGKGGKGKGKGKNFGKGNKGLQKGRPY